MPEIKVTRLPRVRTTQKPEWAEVIDKFYADSFDARTKEALLESAEAFSDMAPEEQAFHQAHLAFRQVQALADIHATLKGIERAIAGLDPKAIAALKHLPAVRKALVHIAKGQEEMIDLLESGAGGATGGDRDDDEGGGEDDDDEDSGDDGEDDESDLEDAVEADEVEEEDHGDGSVEVLVPEVLPAGARPPRPELTAEDVLNGRERGAP